MYVYLNSIIPVFLYLMYLRYIDTEYEDALISKTFIFQFVNSFASLFYIAFVKPFIQQIDPCLNSCMSELNVSLGTIFIMQLLVGNFTEVILCYCL